jgi:hypothetical protein
LEDSEKKILLRLNKSIYSLIESIIFVEHYELDKINYLFFFDNFEAVIINDFDKSRDWLTILPKKIKKIFFDLQGKEYIIEHLPKNIVSLVFELRNSYETKIKLTVPQRVKYLSIMPNAEIMGSIPTSVTKLKLLKKHHLPLVYVRLKQLLSLENNVEIIGEKQRIIIAVKYLEKKLEQKMQKNKNKGTMSDTYNAE